LWISLSSLDYVGHDFGPQSFEAIDMVYHIDRHIGSFMRSMRSLVPAGETLYIVTGDHGVSPIPEILYNEGLTNSARISFVKIIENMNTLVKEHFELDDIVTDFKAPYFYLNHSVFDKLSTKKQDAVLRSLIHFLHKQPCITRAWTYQELAMTPAEPGSLESFFKNGLYHGRSGDIIVQCPPYVIATEHTCGACHDMPYNYNTHVPLIMYQKRAIEREIFHERVYTLQLANTLAYILDVPQPSASLFNILPGVVVQGCE
jgi:arylsulfatase A-like enzyme